MSKKRSILRLLPLIFAGVVVVWILSSTYSRQSPPPPTLSTPKERANALFSASNPTSALPSHLAAHLLHEDYAGETDANSTSPSFRSYLANLIKPSSSSSTSPSSPTSLSTSSFTREEGRQRLANPFQAPPPTSFSDIDIVYTWTDGSREWYRRLLVSTFGRTEGEAKGSRYKDNGELRYSFRSLFQHVPEFRHLYLVTFDERMVPDWLKIEAKKEGSRVTLVPHSAIFRGKKLHSHLPTFNSNAIEVNLWRIPGLSEYFLYVNDDYFFARKAEVGDYISDKGEVKVYAEKHIVEPGLRYFTLKDEKKQLWRSTVVHSNLLLDDVYGQQSRRFMKHSPHLWRRSAWAAMWYIFQDELMATSASKFRASTDIDPRLLAGWFWIGEKRAFPAVAVETEKSDAFAHLLMVSKDDKKVAGVLKDMFGRMPNSGPKVFCLNDNVPRTESTAKAVNGVLSMMFPTRSPVEV
uniref:Uncharacterized protein n=1 Tax=Palpitomonas bilix TaxID=652834 RepID=A0A7S3GCJ4_9EUKA|mmetsp:Transcript_43487/g.113167  ORF Transcript_43487/g.113167 Transcript_43487/m.113167 type:complete len:465 (+) Transcript_43487:70-1464(+)|eukprot:CAMPEP_0113888360 /NCGR_PEP_ID=MMETSP0780_2-20120614/12804_1 /TAXON_ID=652834 /ORGANISM="Palpitomonas bilix" /LENGTH=464 /DNA_ID=CAMNT_0000877151 /DNA_START=54 /DNA_END=1448 /DNA_ORIENTATION=- /assembly_acc=CAM_ASM_000599